MVAVTPPPPLVYTPFAPRAIAQARGALHPEACLGVLMLDTRFPRIVGDVGNPASFAFPVRHAVVEGASPQRVVHERDASLLGPFIRAGMALVAGALCAKGRSVIRNVHLIDRGYENLEHKLAALGAQITRGE